MAGHKYADNVKIMDRLFRQIPDSLREEVMKLPDYAEFDRRFRLFMHRKAGDGGGNTNTKSVVKMYIGARDGVDFRLAYRFDMSPINGSRDDEDTWMFANMSLNLERGLNEDLLETDRYFHGQNLFDGSEGSLLVPASSSWRFKSLFEQRNGRHEIGKILFAEAIGERWIVAWPELKGEPDGYVEYRLNCCPRRRLVDVKTTDGLGDWWVALDSFEMLKDCRAIMAFVRQPGSDRPWLGAVSAESFEPEQFMVKFDTFEQEKADILKKYPHAICYKHRQHSNGSGKTSIIVPRGAVVPLMEYMEALVNSKVERSA